MNALKLLATAAAAGCYALLSSWIHNLATMSVLFSCDASCDQPGEFGARIWPVEIAIAIGWALLLLGLALYLLNEVRRDMRKPHTHAKSTAAQAHSSHSGDVEKQELKSGD